ncbi:penicillin-binding protein 2 [Micrococcales bacterium 31B]|nr:penicillin-binding protein 2 [Micrococcales bacterium 31B]
MTTRRTPPNAALPAVAAGPRRDLKQATGRRHNYVLVIVLVLLLALSGRLIWIQGINQSKVAYDSVASRLARIELPAQRGVISDANGTVMASTSITYSITIDPSQIAAARLSLDGGRTRLEGADAMVPYVADKLGLTRAALAATLQEQETRVQEAIAAGTSPPRYFVIASGISPVERRDIMTYARNNSLPYFSESKESRVYAGNEVGANVLGGLTATDQTPIGGIELSLDEYLKGTDGAQVYEQGRLGQEIPGGENSYVAPVNGSDIKLTIDSDVQWKAQQECTAKLEEIKGDTCTAVVMDVATGAIVALAEAPTYDANNPGAAPAGALVNRSISDVFEPGSTGKVITAAAAIEEGKVTPTTPYTVPYEFTTPNGQVFTDAEHHEELKLTLAGVLAESSNTGTVQVGSTLPAEVRFQYMKKFNMGVKTGVELPGESQGLLANYVDWDGRTNYTTMFGQGYAVNALQQVSVFATVANGGVRMPVHLVDTITKPDGETVELDREQPVQVITKDTSDQIMRMLEGVVAGGTGKSGAVAGYQIAGKTGTAEILGEDPAYVASFIGIAPAENPKYVVGVFVRKSGALIYGSEVAAPVFSDLMTYVLQKQSVPPSLTPAVPYPLTW